jgi:cytochrome d ubiquinol oxidase subunit I
MRTSEAVSPHGAAPVALTLAIFVVVYLHGVRRRHLVRLKIIAKGPASGEAQDPVEGGPASRARHRGPLSAAPERTTPSGEVVEGAPH